MTGTLVLLGADLAGLLLVASAWSKLRDPGLFAEIVGAYPMPAFLRRAQIVRAVPACEGLMGVALLSVHPRGIAWGAAAALVFVASTSFIVAIRLVRGEKRFRCGCGGNLAQPHSAAWVIARNVALMIPLGFVFQYSGDASNLDNAAPMLFTACAMVMGTRLVQAAWQARGATNEWKAPG